MNRAGHAALFYFFGAVELGDEMVRKINTKALLTLREASQRLGVSVRTLQRLIAKQLIRYYRIGSLKIMFSERQLSDYLTTVERPTEGVVGDAN